MTLALVNAIASSQLDRLILPVVLGLVGDVAVIAWLARRSD